MLTVLFLAVLFLALVWSSTPWAVALLAPVLPVLPDPAVDIPPPFDPSAWQDVTGPARPVLDPALALALIRADQAEALRTAAKARAARVRAIALPKAAPSWVELRAAGRLAYAVDRLSADFDRTMVQLRALRAAVEADLAAPSGVAPCAPVIVANVSRGTLRSAGEPATVLPPPSPVPVFSLSLDREPDFRDTPAQTVDVDAEALAVADALSLAAAGYRANAPAGRLALPPKGGTGREVYDHAADLRRDEYRAAERDRAARWARRGIRCSDCGRPMTTARTGLGELCGPYRGRPLCFGDIDGCVATAKALAEARDRARIAAPANRQPDAYMLPAPAKRRESGAEFSARMAAARRAKAQTRGLV